jgi:hypothetical protein
VVKNELSDKGFLVAAADDLISMVQLDRSLFRPDRGKQGIAAQSSAGAAEPT